MEQELAAQDVIDALIEQRNLALNELARAQAMIRTLQRKPGNGALPAEPDEERRYGDTGELPPQHR
jgi:hypothetical protein